MAREDMEERPPKRTIIDDVVQLAITPEQTKGKARLGKKKKRRQDGAGEIVCILDGGIENLGGEVICGHIATYRYGIAAGSLDLVHDSLRLLFVEAGFVSTMYGRHQHHSFTCKKEMGPFTR